MDLSRRTDVNFQSRVIKQFSGKTGSLNKYKSKDFHNEFNYLSLEPATALGNWVREFNLDEDIFYASLPLVKKSTSEPKLLSMQFKIIHQITNCGSKLNKWKIARSDKCQFGNYNMTDNVRHALGECESTKQITNGIFKELNPKSRILHNISIEQIKFGVEDSAINMKFLLVKNNDLILEHTKTTFRCDV